MEALTKRNLQFAILQIATTYPNGKIGEFNLLGNDHQPGNLESSLGIKFSPEDRMLAHHAFQTLLDSDFLRLEWHTVSSSTRWGVITTAGKEALARKALDDLDSALIKIDSQLLSLRDGAHEAITSKRQDSVRQAAHSMRELLRQVLDKLASEDEIKNQSGFNPNDKITRKMRVRFSYKKIHGSASYTQIDLIESQCVMIDNLYGSLSDEAHRDVALQHRDVQELIGISEICLRRLICTRYNN